MATPRAPEPVARITKLAAFIRREEGAIVEDWLQQARKLASAQKLERSALIDHVPPILQRIAELARGTSVLAPTDLGSAHARERLDAGFELDEIVAEYTMLRQVILARFVREHATGLDPSSVIVLDRAIDAAIAASILAYHALDRKARQEAAEHRARQQLALADFGMRALATHDVEAVLSDALDVVVRGMGTELAEILALAPGGEALIVRATVGWTDVPLGTRILAGPLSEGGFALATGQPVVVPDTSLEQRFEPSPICHAAGVVSGVSIVIPGPNGGPFGVLGTHTRYRRSFTDHDLAFLQSVANVLAAAIARDQDERRIGEAQASLGVVLEHVREYGIYMLDPDGYVMTWNRGAERITGYSADEVSGKHDAVFHTREDVEAGRPWHALEDARAQGSANFEGWRVRKDGALLWVAGTITAVRDAGRLRWFAVVLRDVTERKHAEEAQRFLIDVHQRLASSLELEATLALVAELGVSRFGDFCAVDLVDDAGRVRRAAVAHAGTTGSTQDLPAHVEVPPMAMSVIRTGRPAVAAKLERDLAERRAASPSALRELDMDWVSSVPLATRGQVIGALTIACERAPLHERDLELAREFANRAAVAIDNARLYRSAHEAIARREEVLGIVSHDLRNPLNTIQMGASLLEEDVPDDLKPHAARIVRASDRMNRMIQDLLDVAAIEKGHLSIQWQPEDARSIIDEAAESARVTAAEKSLNVEIDVRGTLPPVCADRDRALQVLGNLLSNALRITPQGGRIVIGAEARVNEVVFWVKDSGPGIEPEAQGLIFERYWRGPSVKYKGTGRGLAIAKGIVDAHRGRIWVQSRLGEGATFYFSIPTVRSDEDDTQSGARR
jgi:PAS domain S-box-containing protein